MLKAPGIVVGRQSLATLSNDTLDLAILFLYMHTICLKNLVNCIFLSRKKEIILHDG